ncbi:MAG: hypothetical protein HYS83_01270 [Candidatus Blackburnbacteria bacterium]|nr:hypothetical protein [Candidatus Blackburnbacteria bacterium]
MKLNEQGLANASAVLVAAVYIICALFVVVLPDFSKAVAGSWFHGIDLDAIWTGAPRGNFILGFVSSVVLAWTGGWVFAWVYNKSVR